MSQAVKHRRRVRPFKVAGHLALAFWALTNIFPFVWVLMNSFRTRQYILSDSFSIPTDPTLENFTTAFDKLNIFHAYANSFIISTSVTVLVCLLGGLAAYALTRFSFRGHGTFMFCVYACLMIPVFSTIIPVFGLLLDWGLVNTLPGMILPQTAGGLAMAIIILMGYMKSIPVELEEAAFLEGCDVAGVFFRVVLPMSKPALATVAIFTFLNSYNDLFTQLFILRKKDVWAINRLLSEISSQYGTDYGLLCASIVLVVVPVLIVYVFLQKHIIKGMMAGAVKG